MIEIDRVSKYFGDIAAVTDFSLCIPRGVIFGLIGHNGAGKSTLFKMLLGLLTPTSGGIRYDGNSSRSHDFRELRRGIGYLPENVVLYENLTALETLQYFAALKHVDKNQCEKVLTQVGLAGVGHRKVQGYSKGMRQRLGFAQALLGSPPILFLDEPTNGLDPVGIREFYDVLCDMRDHGTTIVLTSHILAEIQQRVDGLAIIRSGKLQAEGTVQSLREKIDLPVSVEVRLTGNTAELERGIQEMGFRMEPCDGGLRIQCERSAKLPLLNWLSQSSHCIGDIQIHEPSLEDVFMGYSSGDCP